MRRLAEFETFVAVARAGSITKAAEQLGTAKSVVSRRIAELESRLGAPLLLRTTRKMSLTEAGHALLLRAEAILEEIEAAEAAVAGGHAALSGRLRIAAPLSFGNLVLQPLIARFAAENQEVDIEVDLADREVNLVEEGFDLALRIGKLADSSLIARKVAPVAMACVAAPSFWDSHGRPERPEALEALPCLLYARGGRPGPLPYWQDGGRGGAVSPPARLMASNGDFLAAMAAEGLGFTVLPRFIAAPLIAEGRLETALPAVRWSDIALYLVTPPNRRPSARTRRFSEAVLDTLGQADAI
jgi:DNA-binding transcriptional LysR family regulator